MDVSWLPAGIAVLWRLHEKYSGMPRITLREGGQFAISEMNIILTRRISSSE